MDDEKPTEVAEFVNLFDEGSDECYVLGQSEPVPEEADEYSAYFRVPITHYTPEEMARKMGELKEPMHPDEIHKKADALMCEVLYNLGFTEAVKTFVKLPKWYA